MPSIKTSLPDIASHIDHSLLHPTLTDQAISSGLELALAHRCAAVCITPSAIPLARKVFSSSAEPAPHSSTETTTTSAPPRICTVVGFPHGTSTVNTKLTETLEAIASGAHEIDLVINISKARSHAWAYLDAEIEAVQRICSAKHVLLKVIFENDYLASDADIIKLCEICTSHNVPFVRTSTGFAFNKSEGAGASGGHHYEGATVRQVALMLDSVGPGVQVKAAGGIRTLDALLTMMQMGVKRVGLSATAEIMEDAQRRGITDQESEVTFDATK